MKKLLAIVLLLLIGIPAFSLETSDEIQESRDKKTQSLINKVGFKILNSNRINKKTVFVLTKNKSVNAVAITNLFCGREINIYKGILPFIESEEELAAILSHEISHIVDSYDGFLRGSFDGVKYLIAAKKYEKQADKRAVDYMVNAGYNPVALIVSLNKIAPQYRFEPVLFSTHPLTTRRLMYIYEYIYRKYPAYLVNNKYQNNPYYQNFLLVSMENRKKLKQAIESGSTKSPLYK